MPYKIHIENTESAPGTHIVPELDPILEVATQEEAESLLQSMGRKGVNNVYAVGFECPETA